MTKLKFEFMDGLIIANDEKTLEKVIHRLTEELDKEGFSYEEINQFILIKVKQYLVM
jgi:hypothetical protein